MSKSEKSAFYGFCLCVEFDYWYRNGGFYFYGIFLFFKNKLLYSRLLNLADLTLAVFKTRQKSVKQARSQFPLGVAKAGLWLAVPMLFILCLFSFMTATSVIEVMVSSNAIKELVIYQNQFQSKITPWDLGLRVATSLGQNI